MFTEQELDCVNSKLEDTRITLGDALNNLHYSRMSDSVVALHIPNSLFWLWQKKRELERKLKKEITGFSAMATISLTNAIKLNISSFGLETRLQSETSRFCSKYKKAGGAIRKKLLNKVTNILLQNDDIVPHVSQ